MRRFFHYFWPWLSAGFWWLFDKLYGDVVFAKIKPMIPLEITNISTREIFTYLPPIVLIGIGFWIASRKTKESPAQEFSTSEEIRKIAPLEPEEIIDTVTGKKPQTAQRDAKLSDALGYIEARAWGHHWSAFMASTESSQPGGSSPREIRQAARDGEIRVWGRTSQNSPHQLIPPEYWQIWQVEYFSAMEGNSKTEIAEAGHYGGQIYYDLMVSKLEIENRWPPSQSMPSKPKPTGPNLKILPDGGMTAGISGRVVLSIEVENFGEVGEVSAKIGPPSNGVSVYTPSNRSSFLAPAPAIWNGKSNSTIKMHSGARENIIVGIVDGKSRTIEIPHFDDVGVQSVWKMTSPPIGKKFPFVMRLEFTADPSLPVSPLKKKVSFDLTIQGNGEVVMQTDPTMVTDA